MRAHPSVSAFLARHLIAAALLVFSTGAQADLTATFNAASDFPLTASSYTASGDATFTLNFAPEPGTNLTVVKNTGLPFIQSTFNNLANGATVNLSYNGTTYPFVAWYYGGQGNNDLVLLWPHTRVAAWGKNSNGQLGDSTTTQRNVPVTLTQSGVLAGKTIVQVVRGQYHTLVLTSEGRVYAWGLNSFGQLGNNTTNQSLVPVVVTTSSGALFGKTVVALAAGYAQSLALCSDGTVASWGSNSHGQLGDNSTTQRLVPVAVTTSSGLFNKTVVGLAAGGGHSLALCSDGTVAAWGYNSSGQLGDNTKSNQPVPVTVNTDSGTSALFGKIVMSLATGVNHSLALCSDGSLVAWGDNTYRQLGDNTTTSRTAPVAVNTASGTSVLFNKAVVVIATGELHNLALCSDGSLAGWGNNFYGQLGDGTTTDRSAPVAVSMAGVSVLSGRTVVDLAAGTNHSMALCSDGSLAAWGFNSSGQLGDNTTTNRLAPVAVNTASGVSALAGQNSIRLTGPGSGAYHSTAISLYMVDPEITIRGNNVEIVNGDTSPSSTDHSDFGSVNLTGGSMARTFTISNTEAAVLNLTGIPKVVISGSHAADFTVTAQPVSPLSPFTGTSTFQITFDPSAQGVRYATVSIANDDDNENPYTFSIQGAGLEPEIRVEQPLGMNLAIGGVKSFGAAPLGCAVDLVFTIKNTGANGSLLTGLGIVLDGADASEFSVVSSPTAPVVGPAGFTSFSVRFAPTTTGTKTAALHLASNDNDESPFHILLSGEGAGNVTATFNADSDVGSTFSGVNAAGRTLDLTLNYAPRPGTNLTVVKNTSPSFIQGTFNNMPNGSTVNLSYNGITYPFIVWYYGGDGNDLVLLWPYTGLAAWGDNSNGQLGDNTTTLCPASVAVDQTGDLAGKTIVKVVRGTYHTLALTSEGRVYAWGRNYNGQLGNNTTTQRNAPFAVNTTNGFSALYGKTVVAIAAGAYHSLALCSDGTLVAWGYNGSGQLGNNTTTQRNAPVAVNTSSGISALFGKTVVAVEAGSSHSLALCSDGTVAAWGWNSGGQLGDNTTTPRNAPTAVNTTSGTSALFGKTVVTLAAGSTHSLALCSDGTMAAWGNNYDGQLGHGTTTQRSAPVAVNRSNGTSALFGKTAVAIAAGGYHSLALCSDGTLAAWGKNNCGQFGSNAASWSSTLPVAVNRISGISALFGKTVTAITAGEYYTLALCSDGLVAAWGNGFSGQLGNNQSAQYNVPVAVNSSSDNSMLTGRKVSALAGAGSLANHSLAIYGTSLREIATRGNSVKITNGDATPSSTDHTDFGSCLLTTTTVVRTFTISSAGFTELNLTGTPKVVVSGTHAADFTVTTQPVSPVPALVGNTTFQIKFDPSALGVRSATLSIANDDSAFTFSIQGTGGNASVPATTTVAATGITFNGATLNGKVNANNSERTVVFDYGTTTSYGSTASATPETLTGNTLTNVSATITGLLPHTKYYFRVRAAGPLGGANGATTTFTTVNRPPFTQDETVLALPSAKVTIPVLANDSDPDGDALSIASFTQPGAAVGTVAKVGTNLVFTPSATFAGGHFTYMASDALGLKSNAETVWLVLADIDVPPEIEISADSAPYALNVYSEAPFMVSESIPWLSFVMPTPDENGVLFYPAPNPSKNSRTGTVQIGGKTQTVTQSGIAAAPEIAAPDPILNAAFGANYDLVITTLNGPVTYTTTGMPKGLTLSNITGHITGYPTEVKTSTVTVKAKNVWGDSNTITFDISVLPFPPALVGSYSAEIVSDEVLTDKLGGLMTMTVASAGSVSGNLKLGTGNHAFTGRMNVEVDPQAPYPVHAVLKASIKRTGKPAVDLTVNMNFNGTDYITGDVRQLGTAPGSAELYGSKHVWHAITKPADAFKGYFTAALEPTDAWDTIPQGDGFLTFSVSTAGAVSWSGQLADGTIITTQSATLWASGEIPLYALLYGGKGSLSQLIYIEPETKAVSGSPYWHKKPQATRAFAAGFDPLNLNAIGAEYLPPGIGKTLLNIVAPGGANIDFSGGGMDSVSQFSDLDQVFNVSATHAATFAGVNPALVKLTKLDVIKGTFTGSLTLKDNNPFNAALPLVSRPVTFNGVLLPASGKGTGYFLLPGITGPPANVTTSPMTSGLVRIVP